MDIEKDQRFIPHHRSQIQVKPLPFPINSPFHDFSPTLTFNEELLIFNSNRPGGMGKTDLYECFRVGKGWSKPRNIAEINSKKLDETPFITPNGKILFFSSNRKGSREESSDIYLSYRKGKIWGKPISLSANINSVYAEKSPSLSHDGKYLLFTRHPVGRIEDARLMLSVQKKGIYHKALTLPAPININAMETCPVFHPSGKGLFFSSFRNGKSWDIYWLPVGKNTVFGKIKALPFPINTESNEAFFTMTRDSKTFYFSRLDPNSNNKMGNYNIYKVCLPDLFHVFGEKKKNNVNGMQKVHSRQILWMIRVFDKERNIPINADIQAYCSDKDHVTLKKKEYLREKTPIL